MDPKIITCHDKAKAVLKPTAAQLDRGLELHRDLLVCDAFGFSPLTLSESAVREVNALIDEGYSGRDLSMFLQDLRATSHATDERCREQYQQAFEAAGVDAIVATAAQGQYVDIAVRGLARHQMICDEMPDFMRKALRADDIRKARAEGLHSMVLSANNPAAQGGFRDGDEVLDWVRIMHRFGVRVMHLTYNRRNWVGDGCVEDADAGLSGFGHDVVGLMNDLGILIDTPHSGMRTTIEAAQCSRAPVAATHTAARGVYDHQRGKTDEAIKAIADTDGLIGICVIPYFLGENGTVADLLDHIDYVAKLVGVDHVAIGTDTAYSGPMPEGVELKPFPKFRSHWFSWWPKDVKLGGSDEHINGSLAWVCWPYFTVGLVTRGYSDEDIEKILSGNFLRVMGAVEQCRRVEFPASPSP